MEFIRYEKIEDFIKENLELILEKEWLNCLMVGNCLEGEKIGAQDWLLSKVVQNEKTEIILLYRKPWKLILYSPTNNISDELYKFTAEQVYKQDRKLLGVNAETEMTHKFARFYCEIAKKHYRLENSLKILVLEKMLPKQNENNAIFRIATEQDKTVLIQYIRGFYKDALQQELSVEDANQKFETYLERGYYVLEKEGKIVSQAVIGRTLIKGKCISGVYTPKEERGNGYAYELVYELSKKCLDEGAEYCVLYTDAENPISNHIYEKMGYVKRTECEELEFF